MPSIHSILVALGKVVFSVATVFQQAGNADWGALFDWAAVGLPTILAVVAAMMTTMRIESRASKYSWRIGLLAFGVLISAVIWEQQKVARTNAAAQAADYYKPAGILAYEGERLTFYNKSKSTLYLWGDKLDGEAKDIESEPRILPIDAYYYFLADRMNNYFLRLIGNDGEQFFPFEIYFKNEQGMKYVSRFDLLVKIKDGKISVHTQMLSFDPGNW